MPPHLTSQKPNHHGAASLVVPFSASEHVAGWVSRRSSEQQEQQR